MRRRLNWGASDSHSVFLATDESGTSASHQIEHGFEMGAKCLERATHFRKTIYVGLTAACSPVCKRVGYKRFWKGGESLDPKGSGGKSEH
jgi:hypothetical protein